MSYGPPQYAQQISLGGRLTPGVKGLIIANVAMYIVQKLAGTLGGQPIEPIFQLDPGDVIHHKWVWQLVTYMFLHSTDWLSHLILNMAMLWLFGTEVEKAWGTRRFIRYYFVCGIGAGITSCLLFRNSVTIGASGAVFGVMLAYAMLFPNRMILFWFVFPMRARNFVLLCAGIELFMLLGMQDGIAHYAHLGGMLFGYLDIKRVWRIRPFIDELRWKLRRRRFKVMPPDERYPFH